MAGFAVFAIAMNGCDALYLNEAGSLQRVQQKREIVVLTTRTPLVYYRSRSGETGGIDHDLLENFAKSFGLKLRYKLYPNENAVMVALRQGEGDLAAARLRPPDTDQGFLVGPSYADSHLSLFCRSSLQIENIHDLAGKKVWMFERDNLADFSRRLIQFVPLVNLEMRPDDKVLSLIQSVQQGKADCAIVEQDAGLFAARYNPAVEMVSPLSENFSLNWLLTPDNHDLWILMQAWFQQASRNDEIMRVMDRYRMYIEELDRSDLRGFRHNIREALPEYRSVFQSAAREHRLPWQLVAAVAYQESHWDPHARSFTGVRGLMQLTMDTAEHLGIADRTDPVQSIWGGAKYLRYLLNKVPRSINSKDRMALALAAYNVGYAHLRDAQKLAIRLGYNPYSWRHLREVLPLLSEDRYAQQLEYGSARGSEAVSFVERVKSFYNYMIAYN